ncbi:hypothetical protein GWA97_10115 [Flavobacterium sp. LaA7.5]|nr:hypothetical protein [Flavobacterium salilacus subsp. altitudinum]
MEINCRYFRLKSFSHPEGYAKVPSVVNDKYNPDNFEYKYNGKELQDELGLNVTAMDYRMYDNALGRFMGMDRLSEMSYSITPYRFAYNNPVYWNDPTGLLEQNSENLEQCLTCPNTPEFKPLIDDPNNTYFYDPETKQASLSLDEVVISTTRSNQSDSNSPNGLEILDFSYNFAGDYGKELFDNGSYKQTNGNIGNFNDRPFKRLSKNAKARYGFAKDLKTLKKAGIVTTVILGSIEVSNGAIQDYKNYETTGSTDLKNTAVAGAKVGAGIAVGWAAGAATGAAIGSFIPIPIVGTLAGAIVGGIAGYYASEAAGNLVEKAYE